MTQSMLMWIPFHFVEFHQIKKKNKNICKLETIKIHVKKMTANRKVSLRLAWADPSETKWN